ncbi:hypothetical protein B0T14DRAFT_241413 [Immersiella caudata]|uniref:Uncharacterized protein n=1 Tax=Immersiella caudata TaxID=314043 RepID=A0AA40C188_9PEZI|nr:hypothetical protein B0T14DRAFT_241413 [Immersiella caudata]
MLCFLPPEPQQPTSPASPQGHIFGNAAPDEKELEDAANVLEKARRVLDYTESRRHHDLRQIRASGKTEEVKKDRDLLVRVVTAKIKDLRGYVYNLGEGKCDYDFPYDDIIQKITWEVVDNPNAATIMGAEDVEDLVALLEAASRCEAKFREWGTKKRLVYQSLRCLRDCLEALRLYAADALTSSAHIHCKSPKCTSPGLAGLSERLPRYINCLTSALLQKKRDEVDDWLLVFYSLCIQSYVRRVLIRLEHGWQQQSKTGNTGSKPGCSDFLQTAVTLFCQVSAQKGGRLAAQIKDSPVQASAYVGVSSLGSLSTVPLAQPTGESPWAWDQWREEGVERHLKRIFDTQDNALVILHCPDDEAYDSDATITTTKAGAQRGARRNRESNGSLQQLNPSKRVQLTEESLSTRATTPSISSRHSMTSYADSDVASLAETWNSSTLSFSTYNTNLGE